MPAQSPAKTGVNALLSRASTSSKPSNNKDVDGRDKPGHDVERSVIAAVLVQHLLRRRLALVEDAHLGVARRLVGEVLLAVDGAARDIIVLAGLEHLRRLALDREGDLALLHRRPLVAGMAVELVAGTRRHG